MFHANCFIYGATQSFGDTAITHGLTAARWGVLAWGWYHEAFFSDRALARYEWIGQMLGCMMSLAYLYTKRWVDAQVAAAEPQEFVIPPVPAVAAAIDRIEAVPATELPWLMTSAELRKECSRLGIEWRNAHGKGKHLRKGEMVAVLG